MKKIKSGILVLLACLLVFFILSKQGIVQVNLKKDANVYTIKSQLLELSELTTLKYEYSNVIVSRTEKSINIPGLQEINYAESIKLIHYTGYLKAGTDLSTAVITNNSDDNSVTIKIQRSKILDNVIESENTTVEDVKGTILSEYPSQTIFDEINKSKEEIEKDQIENGFLDKADKRIIEIITAFLKTAGHEKINIEFIG